MSDEDRREEAANSILSMLEKNEPDPRFRLTILMFAFAKLMAENVKTKYDETVIEQACDFLSLFYKVLRCESNTPRIN